MIALLVLGKGARLRIFERRFSGCPVERLPSFLHAVPVSDTVPIRWSDGYNDDTSLTVLGARPTKVDAGSAWDEEEGFFSPVTCQLEWEARLCLVQLGNGQG